MTSIFVTAAIISVSYLIVKFFEMRYIEKESKPLKILIQDSLLVYFSVFIANFIIEQLTPVIEGNAAAKLTPVFTDNPGF